MQKVYILDTNTLIENPDCLEAFRNGQENKVLIPYSVIMELDRLKTRPDLTHIIALVADRLEHDSDFSVIHIPTKTYSVSKTNDDDIVTKFKGHRNYGHMVLKGSKSRGPITDLVLKTDL